MKEERIRAIESEIVTLTAERDRINSRLDELNAELGTLVPSAVTSSGVRGTRIKNDTNYSYPASEHILDLLSQCQATSKSRAKELQCNRAWLDKQLIGKVDGVNNDQAVSHGLIELKKKSKIDYEKQGSKPIGLVWLKLPPMGQ